MADHERSVELLKVADLAYRMPEVPPGNDEGVLYELVHNAVSFLPGAQYAGITISTAKGAVQTVAATHSLVDRLDDVQRRHQEGPCLSAGWEQNFVRVDDLAVDDRWPNYRDDAVGITSIRSILSVHMFRESRSTGALNFYADSAHAFDEDSVEDGLIFATHTALVWNIMRRSEQFRSALASRDVIGQAKGMLMERFHIDAVQAFNLLKRLSQSSNTPVAGIARGIVHADRRPE